MLAKITEDLANSDKFDLKLLKNKYRPLYLFDAG